MPGLEVGHSSDADAATGCTVILGPFRASMDLRGLASGTRQLDSLSPFHITPQVDALLLTGGSAYGLAAADGVAHWLEEEGRGFETRAGRVAIVPSAVIFDLGRGRVARRRPDAAMGQAACESASREPVPEGRVGVGTGATVGKVRGVDGAMPGGVGSWAARFEDHTMGALAVVNAFGGVVDAQGRLIAGARDAAGRLIETAAYIRQHGRTPGFDDEAGTNTTLGVVATDYPLTRYDLHGVARQAMNAIVRHIEPASTQFDGDLVFAGSTGPDPVGLPPAEALRVGLWAEWVLARAIERAVSEV